MIEPLGGSTVPGQNPVDTHTEGGRFTVVLDMGFCDEAGMYGSVKTTIRAKAVAIEKPGEEGERIRG